MTSLNDFKNLILENKAPQIVQNYYCPLMCTLCLRNRYFDKKTKPFFQDFVFSLSPRSAWSEG